MDQSDCEEIVLESSQRSNYDSLARQSSLRCVDGDNIVIISNDADDVNINGHLALWKCANCNTVNPVTASQCISCLALQSPDSLLMEGEKNGQNETPAAEDVKDSREVVAMDVDRDDKMWVCRRCTLQNVAESTRCEVCEAPRHSVSFSNRTLGSSTAGRGQQLADAASKVDVHGTGDGKVPTPSSGLGVDKSDNAAACRASKADTQNTEWSVWTCPNCTYNNNPSWANICDVCETVKQLYSSPQKQAGNGKAGGNMPVSVERKDNVVATSWRCDKCTTVNANSVRDCTCCGALRMTPDTKPVQDTWTCAKCTLQNSNMAHVCAACLGKRDTILPQIDNSGMKWSCPKCTCINHSSQNVCQACGHHKHDPCNSNHQMPDKPKSNAFLGRQNSVRVREQQTKEEMAAHDQWTQIVNFCKVVSYLGYVL